MYDETKKKNKKKTKQNGSNNPHEFDVLHEVVLLHGGFHFERAKFSDSFHETRLQVVASALQVHPLAVVFIHLTLQRLDLGQWVYLGFALFF